MKLQTIIDILNDLAPHHLSEPWDRTGLQVGDPAWHIRRGLLCIDLTPQVLQEAITAATSLIVAYHPPIFSPLPAVTSRDAKQRIILEAARHKIAVYSPHTALDAAAGGVNDWLCDGLGSGKRRPIRSAESAGRVSYKLVTFVPDQHADRLRAALSAAGAGVIGDYTHCSFNMTGEGTFYGGASTQPVIGQAGRLERVAELRIEMVCSAAVVKQVIAALRQAHPYQEPAFDLYRVETLAVADDEVGQGRVMTLDQPITLATLIQRVKNHLRVSHLEVAMPRGRSRIQRIGLCAGAGGSLLTEAGEIDAFLTGEMRHHDVLAARTAGLAVLLAGHTQTERPYLKVFRRRITAATGKRVDWRISKADRPPSQLC